MIRAKTVDGVHKPENDANKYTQEQLMLMKTQDIGYVLQKEKKKVENLTVTLHFTDHPPSNKHIYFAEDREEAKELRSQLQKQRSEISHACDNIPATIKRKTARSYKILEEKKAKVKQLEQLYLDMIMQELQKKGRKRKLRKDELVNPTK